MRYENASEGDALGLNRHIGNTRAPRTRMHVVLGATGNTGSVVVERLLAANKRVRAVGRNVERLERWVRLGADTFAADLTDTAALTQAFSGARAAYVLIPPDIHSNDYRSQQIRQARSIAGALEAARVKYVVSLSSLGASESEGTGVVLGLYHLEQSLNHVHGLNVRHLRAGYFMENTLPQISAVPITGKFIGPYRPDLQIPMIASHDIGEAAAEELLGLDFTGHSERELLGPRDMTMPEAATIMGNEIGKPDVRYEQIPDAEFLGVLTQMGASKNVVELLIEMAHAQNEGRIRAREPRSERNTTPTTYERFLHAALGSRKISTGRA